MNRDSTDARITLTELPGLYARLSNVPRVSARALQFTVLTAARAWETLDFSWRDFDTATSTWRVAGMRELGCARCVPLSAPAYDLASNVYGPLDQELVFPCSLGSITRTSKSICRGRPYMIDARRLFWDWATTHTDASTEAIEELLRAEVRHPHFVDEARFLRDHWADFCCGR